MRCQRCQFENIPSQKSCIKCGSILETDGTKINVYPPRMPLWKKGFRETSRWIRRHGIDIGIEGEIPLPKWVRHRDFTEFLEPFAGLIFSIVPGFAHLFSKRFKEIRWYLLIWFGLLLTGLFLYSSSAGFLLIAAAIGIHAWIALQYGLINKFETYYGKILSTLFIFGIFFFFYLSLPNLIFPNYSGSYISFDIPARNIKQGDYFFVRHNPENLKRGTLVLIHPARYFGAQYRPHSFRSSISMIGQIVGLPGEKIEIENNKFILNSQELDSSKYPVPEWLRKQQFSVKIDDKSYFVSAGYSVQAHGRNIINQDIKAVSVLKAADIEGRAFMVWWPLSRRAFLRDIDG